MHVSLVLTVIGPDRTGLVEQVAAVAAAHEANWVESRMARLSGKFAGLLRLDVPAERADDLAADLRGLAGKGLHVVVERSDAEEPPVPTRPLVLELVGHDRPGIVHDVAHVLAQRHVNVVELNTECFSAPMSGEQLFKATAGMTAPADLDVADLREALEEVAHELDLDLTLEEAQP
jgi:glycine cleavage system regulatory protein